MPNTKFDSKSFNPQAFKYLVDRVPNLKRNELRKSRALTGNSDIRAVFSTQNGTEYARLAMKGLLDGQAVNYDGNTDITATSTKTFEQGVVVVGRAKAWTERDFSEDITGGVDFMGNIAAQVDEYKMGLDQTTLMAVLEGIFAMTGDTKSEEFVDKHTYDQSVKGDGKMELTTLNSAMNQACGANKSKFTLTIMHSDVSTHLENLRLLKNLLVTDSEGVTREVGLYTWNGRMVLVDDESPVETGYYAAASTDTGALKVVADSATPGANEIKVSTVKAAAFYPDGVKANDYVVAGDRYTTFLLGNGCISYEDVGAKVPYEMARDAKTKGGMDTLYMRQRKVFSPFGISYEKTVQASDSPTDAELKNGSNWVLVHTGETNASDRTYINHKAIPIARIYCRV